MLAPPVGALATAATPAAAGDQHARIVAAYGGVYVDPELERTLARIVGRLVAASPDPGRAFRITILNASAVNAFALPDGRLYVTRGLLTLANDASEVAAVLAHEMAHVTANHAALRQELELSAVIVGNVVRDNAADPAAGQAALAISQSSLASFSRQQELEADAIGIRTVAGAGYDAFGASRFLTAMSRFAAWRSAQGLPQDQRAEFLASHPANPERIGAAVTTAAQFGAPGVGETDRARYLAGIDGTVFGEDAEQGFVRGLSYYHAGLGVAFSVPQGFQFENADGAVLATGPDGTALRFDTVDVPFGQALVDYLASGWVNGLDQASITPLIVNGFAAATASASTQGWEFRITVVQAGAATYRFIFANDTVTAAFQQVAAGVAGSFRQLSPAETANLRPLTVALVTVAPGDTPDGIAARMTGINAATELFLILNGLEPGASLLPGSVVKIVTGG